MLMDGLRTPRIYLPVAPAAGPLLTTLQSQS